MSEYRVIRDLQEGEEFIGFYALRRCELREYDGGFRLDVEMSDNSGTLPGVIWDNAREFREQLDKGIVVKVKGRLGSFRDKLQARIEKIRPAKEGEYDPESFIPSTPKDITSLTGRLRSLVDSIRDPDLFRLGELIFGDPEFMKKFTGSPGGMKWHHSYLGGLLEHTVSVTELCDFAAQQHPELNRDLLVLAALLHDVGKIWEYSATTLIDYTDEGRLVGHIVMGERFVREKCGELENFPDRLSMLLSHLMLSHQGHKEFSSPVEPMIPEGFVLYYADEMDSKLNALGRIVQKAQDEERSWSEFIRNLNRYIYVEGSEDKQDESE